MVVNGIHTHSLSLFHTHTHRESVCVRESACVSVRERETSSSKSPNGGSCNIWTMATTYGSSWTISTYRKRSNVKGVVHLPNKVTIGRWRFEDIHYSERYAPLRFHYVASVIETHGRILYLGDGADAREHTCGVVDFAALRSAQVSKET